MSHRPCVQIKAININACVSVFVNIYRQLGHSHLASMYTYRLFALVAHSEIPERPPHMANLRFFKEQNVKH